MPERHRNRCPTDNRPPLSPDTPSARLRQHAEHLERTFSAGVSGPFAADPKQHRNALNVRTGMRLNVGSQWTNTPNARVGEFLTAHTALQRTFSKLRDDAADLAIMSPDANFTERLPDHPKVAATLAEYTSQISDLTQEKSEVCVRVQALERELADKQRKHQAREAQWTQLEKHSSERTRVLEAMLSERQKHARRAVAAVSELSAEAISDVRSHTQRGVLLQVVGRWARCALKAAHCRAKLLFDEARDTHFASMTSLEDRHRRELKAQAGALDEEQQVARTQLAKALAEQRREYEGLIRTAELAQRQMLQRAQKATATAEAAEARANAAYAGIAAATATTAHHELVVPFVCWMAAVTRSVRGRQTVELLNVKLETQVRVRPSSSPRVPSSAYGPVQGLC